jgi:hypothetical protein
MSKAAWFLTGWFSGMAALVIVSTPLALIRQHLMELWAAVF